MKYKKYTYRSPLNGSVVCEGLTNEDDNRVDFGPDGVAELYNRGDDVLMFMTRTAEDLKDYVPASLKSVVIRAEFGELCESIGLMCLLTTICTKRELTEYELVDLHRWIEGQLSDGWGEGVEQTPVIEECITFTTMSFDEVTCKFETDEQNHCAYYYLHPWQSGKDWYLELCDVETVEEAGESLEDLLTEAVEVSCLILPDRVRTIYKLPSVKHFREFCGHGFEYTGFYSVLHETENLHPEEVYLRRDYYIDEEDDPAEHIIRPAIGFRTETGYVLRDNYNFGGYDRTAYANLNDLLVAMLK